MVCPKSFRIGCTMSTWLLGLHLLLFLALILQYCFMAPLFYPAQDHSSSCVGVLLAGWQPQRGLLHRLDWSVGLTAKIGRLPVQTDHLITAYLLYTSHCQSPAGQPVRHPKNLWARPRGAAISGCASLPLAEVLLLASEATVLTQLWGEDERKV